MRTPHTTQRTRAPAAVEAQLDAQTVIGLPAREMLTLFDTSALPDMSQMTGASQTTSQVSGTVSDTQSSTTGIANNVMQSMPAATGATAQNINSPNSTSIASQTQSTT